MKTRDVKVTEFWRDIPAVVEYEVLSKAVFFGVVLVYKWITGFMLWNLGRPAFTSGDLPYLLRSWQGWLLVLSGFMLLVLYSVFDINATILISDRLIRRKPLNIYGMLKEAFKRMKNFNSPLGVLVILYVSLIVPLTGLSVGISLTSNFVIPEFILSVINGNIVLRIAYNIVLLVMTALGIIYIFTFHFAILKNMKVRQAMKASRRYVKENWKEIFTRYALFIVKTLGIFVLLILAAYYLPNALVKIIPADIVTKRALMLFFDGIAAIVLTVASLFFIYALMLKLTLIFKSMTSDEEVEYKPIYKNRKPLWISAIVLLVIGSGVLSVYLANNFDEIFPAKSSVEVIAHRGGGTLANENTVVSLDAAVEYGAKYSEIDVQRTKDGHYIINHDDTFERCCGDPRTPGEMTLAEIKQLRVKDSNNPLAEDVEVATMEEILDAAKGRIGLYIELKGSSADEQMVDDVYQMVIERDMLQEVKFISLKYELIDYIETTYPEALTGYLCYFSFGDVAKLNCDELLLEAETATSSNIEKIKAANKKVNAWTVNTVNGMVEFLSSDADGIITDEVALAQLVRILFTERTDELRVLNRIL